MKALSYIEAGVSWLLHCAGAMLARSGHAVFANQFFRAAERIVSADIPTFTYARSLWQEQRHAKARSVLCNILEVTPEHAEANNLLGILDFEDDKLSPARRYFMQAIAALPGFAAPYNNLGNVYRAEGNLASAEQCYGIALRCNGEYVEALTNLGAIQNLEGKNQDGECNCHKAIAFAPDFAGAYCNLGNVLLTLGRTGEAVAAYRHALEISPGMPEALVNLALVMEDDAYLAGTIEYYEQQLAHQPTNYLPNLRIAQALQALGRWDEALERLASALAQKPDAADTLFVLGAHHLHIGDAITGIEHLRQVLALGSNAKAETGATYSRLYLGGASATEICESFRQWATRYVPQLTGTSSIPRDTQPYQRLRIGYVSRDFSRHSVSYFLEPILKNHDREHFEIYCYSTLLRGDDFTEKYMALASVWRDISTISDDEVVDLVIEDQIDILIDLAGHTVGNRLAVFACKPAPVQVTYLGHPTTTGLSAIDYRISDAISDPTALTEGHYVERVWHLPGCFVAYQPPHNPPPVSSLPLYKSGIVTFGSFNNAVKINDLVIAVWAAILNAVPSSRLLLKSFSFVSTHGRARVINAFASHGVNKDRINLLGWCPDPKDHLELYAEIDIALDPFPYNGTTTTCEALWMGVPVICLEGERHSARVGATLLTTLGLVDLLAQDKADYVRKAVELAGDSEQLRALREGMRNRMQNSALLDHVGFTKGLEQVYRNMWLAYCDDHSHNERLNIDAKPDSGKLVVSLNLAGVATIRVPASLDVMTRYVVEEQDDWFEDEIRFVRKLLLPGQHVIDVGANYGVYTLSMAAAVGHSGKVCSFEPDPTTARWLRESVELNGFKQVEIIESAVSDVSKRGIFSVGANAELNRLLTSGESSTKIIGVNITTLDRCREELHWKNVDFVKIDAEGQEPLVVRGGRQLLENDSPLVMAEYKHGTQLNHAVLDEFVKLGFDMYRLVPGLQVLMPVPDIAEADPYLLNLFFCRDTTAQMLSGRGLLVSRGFDSKAIVEHLIPDDRWHEFISSLPYSRQWASNLIDTNTRRESISKVYSNSLDHYVQAQKKELPPMKRLMALNSALVAAEYANTENPTLARRITCARIHADLGLRSDAIDLFTQILVGLQRGDSVLHSEPFLSPSNKFEGVACKGLQKDWLVAAVAEWLASNTGFSSFFNLSVSLGYLQVALEAGYGEVGIQSRIELIKRRKEAQSFTTN